MLFGEPGKLSRFRIRLLQGRELKNRSELVFLLVSATLFLTLFVFFMAHALIYLRQNEKVVEANNRHN